MGHLLLYRSYKNGYIRELQYNMKNIVLFSGGIDSATLLYDLISKHRKTDILAVFFYYGQKSYLMEKSAGENITAALGVQLRQINICNILQYSRSSLVKANSGEITKLRIEGSRHEYVSKNTEVEFRNGLMLSACISLAMQLYPKEAVTVYYGAAKTREPYPDCSVIFTEYMNLLASYVSGGKITVKAPLIELGKDEIVDRAKALGVPLQCTWSCYDGKPDPCGICPACLDRKILGVF